jgi:hypothetical protein
MALAVTLITLMQAKGLLELLCVLCVCVCARRYLTEFVCVCVCVYVCMCVRARVYHLLARILEFVHQKTN